MAAQDEDSGVVSRLDEILDEGRKDLDEGAGARLATQLTAWIESLEVNDRSHLQRVAASERKRFRKRLEPLAGVGSGASAFSLPRTIREAMPCHQLVGEPIAAAYADLTIDGVEVDRYVHLAIGHGLFNTAERDVGTLARELEAPTRRWHATMGDHSGLAAWRAAIMWTRYLQLVGRITPRIGATEVAKRAFTMLRERLAESAAVPAGVAESVARLDLREWLALESHSPVYEVAKLAARCRGALVVGMARQQAPHEREAYDGLMGEIERAFDERTHRTPAAALGFLCLHPDDERRNQACSMAQSTIEGKHRDEFVRMALIDGLVDCATRDIEVCREWIRSALKQHDQRARPDGRETCSVVEMIRDVYPSLLESADPLLEDFRGTLLGSVGRIGDDLLSGRGSASQVRALQRARAAIREIADDRLAPWRDELADTFDDDAKRSHRTWFGSGTIPSGDRQWPEERTWVAVLDTAGRARASALDGSADDTAARRLAVIGATRDPTRPDAHARSFARCLATAYDPQLTIEAKTHHVGRSVSEICRALPDVFETPSPFLVASRVQGLEAVADAVGTLCAEAERGKAAGYVRQLLRELGVELFVAILRQQASGSPRLDVNDNNVRNGRAAVLQLLHRFLDAHPFVPSELVRRGHHGRWAIHAEVRRSLVEMTAAGIKDVKASADLVTLIIERALHGETEQLHEIFEDLLDGTPTIRTLKYIADRSMRPKTGELAAHYIALAEAVGLPEAAGPEPPDWQAAETAVVGIRMSLRGVKLWDQALSYEVAEGFIGALKGGSSSLWRACEVAAKRNEVDQPSPERVAVIRIADALGFVSDTCDFSATLPARPAELDARQAAVAKASTRVKAAEVEVADLSPAVRPVYLAFLAALWQQLADFDIALERRQETSQASLRQVPSARRAGLAAIAELHSVTKGDASHALRLPEDRWPHIAGGPAPTSRDHSLHDVLTSTLGVARRAGDICVEASWPDLELEWQQIGRSVHDLRAVCAPPDGADEEDIELSDLPMTAALRIVDDLHELSSRLVHLSERFTEALGPAAGPWRTALNGGVTDEHRGIAGLLDAPHRALRGMREAPTLTRAHQHLHHSMRAPIESFGLGERLATRRAYDLLIRCFAHVEVSRLIGIGAQARLRTLFSVWFSSGFQFVFLALAVASLAVAAGTGSVFASAGVLGSVAASALAGSGLLLLMGPHTDLLRRGLPGREIRLVFPRMWAANAIGVLFLTIGEEGWASTCAMAGGPAALLSIGFGVLAAGYLYWEVQSAERAPTRGRTLRQAFTQSGGLSSRLRRMSRLWLLSINQCFALALVASFAGAATMGGRCTAAPSIAVVPDVFTVYPLSLLLWSTGGTAIGLLLQVLWEEKSLASGLD